MTRETIRTFDTVIGRIDCHVSAGSDEQPVALLWPSLFSTGHQSWGLQLATLHGLGFRTILIDPPGHGDSGPPPATFSLHDCGDAALQILDAEKVARAVFLGVSWGSFVAMQAAITAPHRVTALVLSNTISTPMPAAARFRDRIFALLFRIGLPGGVGRLVVPNLLGEAARRADPAFANELAQSIDRIDKVALSDAARAVLVTREDLTPGLGGIRVPTLVLAGAVDTAVPPVHGERIAAAIPAARYELVAGAGHIAPREAPELVASLLASFLRPLAKSDGYAA